MLRYLLLALAIYVVYKVVFDVIIPVFRASRQVQKQFRTMQQHMHEQANGTQKAPSSSQAKATPQKKAQPGDYIDFEEIK